MICRHGLLERIPRKTLCICIHGIIERGKGRAISKPETAIRAEDNGDKGIAESPLHDHADNKKEAAEEVERASVIQDEKGQQASCRVRIPLTHQQHPAHQHRANPSENSPVPLN